MVTSYLVSNYASSYATNHYAHFASALAVAVSEVCKTVTDSVAYSLAMEAMAFVSEMTMVVFRFHYVELVDHVYFNYAVNVKLMDYVVYNTHLNTETLIIFRSCVTDYYVVMALMTNYMGTTFQEMNLIYFFTNY